MPDPVRFGDSALRIDGLYRRCGSLAGGRAITSFLQFAGDGMVQSASILGERLSGREGETELKRRPAAERLEGTFALEGALLSFETRSANGLVEYRGTVEADSSLFLNSHSHITGNREEGERFEFVESTGAASAPPPVVGPCRAVRRRPWGVERDWLTLLHRHE